MDIATLEAEIATTTLILTALGAAILALADPTVSSYSLDTGQTSQTVRRQDLPALYKQRTALQGELCALQARLSGSGAVQVRPWF